jgi:hypothetical protein
VIGASTGIFGAVWARAQLRKSLGIAGARVIDAELAVGGAHPRSCRPARCAIRASRPRCVTWWPHSSMRSRSRSPSWPAAAVP